MHSSRLHQQTDPRYSCLPVSNAFDEPSTFYFVIIGLVPQKVWHNFFTTLDYSSYAPTLPETLEVPFEFGWTRQVLVDGYIDNTVRPGTAFAKIDLKAKHLIKLDTNKM
jgi:hypothetical protein